MRVFAWFPEVFRVTRKTSNEFWRGFHYKVFIPRTKDCTTLKIDKHIQTLKVVTSMIMKIFTVRKYWLVEFQHIIPLSEMWKFLHKAGFCWVGGTSSERACSYFVLNQNSSVCGELFFLLETTILFVVPGLQVSFLLTVIWRGIIKNWNTVKITWLTLTGIGFHKEMWNFM